MNTAVSLPSLLTMIVFVGSLVMTAPGAPSQGKAPALEPTATPGELPRGYNFQIAEGKLMIEGAGSGDKREATLGNVVDVLRDFYTSANIVLSPGLAKLKIADLKLRSICLANDLEAVRVASGNRFEWSGPCAPVPEPKAAVDPATGLPVGGSEPNSGLFILEEPRPTPETGRMVQVFNLGPYLRQMQVTNHQANAESEIDNQLKDVEEIIMEALAVLKQGSVEGTGQPSFRFHRGANLFIVIGTREAIEVASQVVNALPGQSDAPRLQPGAIFEPGPGMNPEPAERFRKRYGAVGTPGPAPPATAPAPAPNPP